MASRTASDTDTIHARVAARAALTPDAPAVADADEAVSYAELDARATHLAHRLRARGVGIETRVAVALPRTPDLIVALLGVLKAGAAYVPVDPDYPLERQQFILEDSQSALVITTADDKAAFEGREALVLDPADRTEEPSPALEDASGGSNAAYVIYTSGTTGTPKGVVIEHRSVLDLLDDPQLAVAPGDVVAQFAPTAFDASVFEIWAALCAGGQVALLSGQRLSVDEIGAQLRQWQPDWLFLTTGLFHLIVAHNVDVLKSVDCLITGGDVLAPAHLRTAAESGPRRLYAAYGPTESTVFATLYPVLATPLTRAPLGQALRGGRVYILDTDLRPVPDGSVGEIYLGGAGVARSYHQRPALSAQRYLPDPFSAEPGARMYRTGDRGSVNSDGNVEFHGRVDRQVKVRGFRVEPEEIEAVLRAHSDVDNAVVTARPTVDNDKRLAAYLLSASERGLQVPALRTWLADRMPAYAIPATFVVMDAFPLDPNGKTDTARLPDPWTSRAAMQGLPSFVAPRTELERVIASAWAEALDLDEVGIEDGFFELGGDSLRSVQLLERLSRSGIALTAAQFFQARTVSALAAVAGRGIVVRS
ncbi:non-ribosomal peptide synthetase [Streptomyces sp. NPDC012461]|uniref:Non-ribosomal peptide synthetase n=2 Tax=unclassified Streptomyces TaxID=2593676 RepID=A0A6G3R0Z3_9ACTN|nr:non-ribosomal peptide synthetase [Streptomyces sp. SID14436]NEC81645.1 non-ribosomal peptide synthetase [Streptomyces sp. SID7958]